MFWPVSHQEFLCMSWYNFFPLKLMAGCPHTISPHRLHLLLLSLSSYWFRMYFRTLLRFLTHWVTLTAIRRFLLLYLWYFCCMSWPIKGGVPLSILSKCSWLFLYIYSSRWILESANPLTVLLEWKRMNIFLVLVFFIHNASSSFRSL